MSIAIVGDNLIHYEAIGRGEPMIFIHGWLGSWRYWWPSMQAQAGRHRAFAFDLWGYGDSSKEERDYSFDRYVHMLDQFIATLGINLPPTLVGHSLGAAIAVRYANLNPSKVKRIVAVSLPIEGKYQHERLLTNDSPTIINKLLGKAGAFPELDSEVRKTDARAINQVAQQMQSLNFSTDLVEAKVPSLILFGDQDPVVRLPDTEYDHLREPTKTRNFIALNSCQHFPMLEQPAQFNRLIQDFMHANGDLSKLSPKEYWQRRTY